MGDTPPTIPGLVPSNIEVRLNTIDLDPNWFFVSHAFCGGTTGVKWGLKSRLDFENAQRMVFEGNELYQSWCDGDTGEMIYMGPAACSSTNCGGGNQARISDIYFANNLIAHSHRVFIIAGRGGSTGTSLPFQAGRFSSVTCFTMLHHVPSSDQQDQLLRELRRVLRPGGMLVGVDSVESPEWWGLHVGDTCVPVDPQRFGGRLQAAGFIEVEVELSAPPPARRFRFVGRVSPRG